MERIAKYFFIAAPLFLFSCSRPPSAAAPEEDNQVKLVTLNAGDTLGESMQEAALPPEAVGEIIKNLRTVFSPRRCRPGDRYEVKFDAANRWESFNYYPGGMEYFAVEKATGGAVTAARRTRPTKKVAGTARGTLRTSLWESMSAQGFSPELIMSFADIFAWQIDFLTEPRAGDTFKVIWEKFVADDGKEVSGRILAAQYNASGTDYTALFFVNARGQGDYYSPDGKSLKSAFLKAPLQFRRISSHFTRRRYHPVLKYFRPHLGIDYAAPSGTPVSSIGEGTVTYAGRKGGFGKFVAIRHANNYSSQYGHLSRYGKGIRTGARVHQGQVIGFVGSTGLSTGPHLDFRVSRSGQFVNFLKLRLPSQSSIAKADAESFKQAKRILFTDLARIR
ncbi:MAG: peptidoglycan DD-metalloendopeptidase family protein [Endomicrobiales bacterium]